MHKLIQNIMLTWKFENIDSIGTLSVSNIFVVKPIYLTWYKKMLVEIAACSLAVVWQNNLPLFLRLSNTARFCISSLILSNIKKHVFHNNYILLQLKCLPDTFSLPNSFKTVNLPIICSLQVFHRKTTKDNDII